MRKILFLLVLILLATIGCSYKPAVTLRVLDAQTREPIEGAVTIVWWDKTEGLPGLSYTSTSKVLEMETGKDGLFVIPTVTGREANGIPNIKVYKPGYVGWHNFSTYTGILFNDITRAHIVKRTDFQYKSQDILLEHWQDGYTHYSHERFLTDNILIDFKYNEIYEKKVREYELPLREIEEKTLRRK